MRKALALLFCSVALAAPSTALAQPAAPKAVSAADLTKAKALFDAGGRAYDAGDFAVALQAFEQAYAIAPRDGVLFSIAQANRRLYTATNDRAYLERARVLYKQYLVAVQSGGRRAEAMRALGDVELILDNNKAEGPAAPAPKPIVKKTLVAVDSPTPGALISIDGSAPKPPQVTVEVASGPHQVKLTAPGFEDKEVTVRALDGELVPVSYELVEKPGRLVVEHADGAEVSIDGRFVGTAPFAKPIDVPSGAHFVSVARNGHESWGADVELERGGEKRLSADLRSTTQRKISYGFMATGAAGLVASAVVFGVSFAKENAAKSTLQKLDTQSITPDELAAYEQAKGDRDNLRTAGGVLAGAGAAVGVVGILLYVVDAPRPVAVTGSKRRESPRRDEPKDRPSIELSVLPILGPTVNGASVSARF